jgi:hypothetical protein
MTMSFCAPCADSARPPGMTMEASAPHCLRSYPGKRAFLKCPTNAPLSFINVLSIGEKFLRETQYYFYCKTPANSHKRSDQITIQNTSSDAAPLRTVTDFYPITAKVKHQLEASLQKTRFIMTAIMQSRHTKTPVLPHEGGKIFYYYQPCDLYNRHWKCLLSSWFLESALIQLKPFICKLKCSLVALFSCAYWACISRNTIYWVLCHLHQEQRKFPRKQHFIFSSK